MRLRGDMVTRLRLVLAGSLTVLAGCHMQPDPGRITVVAIGAAILVVAVYRDLMALAAQPLVIVTKPDPTAPRPRRGGLGGPGRSEGP